jgi:hypothetical protein
LQAQRLTLQVGEKSLAGAGVVLGAALQHLDGRDDRGQRRPQLVRRVGEEAPLGALARALRRAIRHDDQGRPAVVTGAQGGALHV